MTSALTTTDYADVDEMDSSTARTRRDKDRRKCKKGNRLKPVVHTADPLADFYNAQKRNSPPLPATCTVEIDEGRAEDYSDEERKHRPPSPATPVAPTTTEKKPRRSASVKRNTTTHNKPTPPHDSRSAASPLSSSDIKQPSSSAAYTSFSLPSVSYAAPWTADDSLALREWLRDNHFDDSVWEALSEYSIADMLAVTKEDLKELLGTKQGIRLHARIQQYKQQQQQPQLTASSPRQPSRRSASSYSSGSHSRHGMCAINGCTHFSTNVCSIPSCNAALCMAHQNKSLLTGHVYCAACEQETWEGQSAARAAVGR